MDYVDISILKDKVLKDIKIDYCDNKITFVDNNNTSYVMAHKQDCGEEMYIEGVYEYGDIDSLLNAPITIAEEVEDYSELPLNEDNLGYTWKLYQIGTETDYIMIRWYGESMGYYI